MRDLGIFTPYQYCAGGKIEENVLAGVCGVYGGGDNCAPGSSGET